MEAKFNIKLSVLVIISISICISTEGQQHNDKPGGKVSAFFVYHPKSKALFLFDGNGTGLNNDQSDGDSTRNDVWKWDGKTWERLNANGPGQKSLSVGALNEKTGLIYVFGGVGSRGYESKKDDMWSFDGLKWNRIPINSIGTRDHHQIVYMRHLDAFLLYGGLDSLRRNDSTTWLLKNNKFTALQIPGPGTRYHFSLAYDTKREKVVLYGGGKQGRRDETWEFDGSEWKQISTTQTPGERLRHTMVYNESIGMTVLHGGDEDGTTWAWDGKVWKNIAAGGPIAGLQALGYDRINKSIFAFGGSGPNSTVISELWELKNNTWRKIFDNGVWQWKNDRYERISK